MMGLQDTGSICGSSRSWSGGFFQYQRLECRDDDGASARPRRRWLPSLNGKAVCSCFSPLKKLKWSRISSVLLLRKVPQASSKIRHASVMDSADDACPTVVFLSQWGLPVLSRPSSMAGTKVRLPHGKGF
uniref:Uncharacterized protein n=1 Tax=Avena sativa TaxID=4498 RepID=A0ACD5XX32_AVESA